MNNGYVRQQVPEKLISRENDQPVKLFQERDTGRYYIPVIPAYQNDYAGFSAFIQTLAYQFIARQKNTFPEAYGAILESPRDNDDPVPFEKNRQALRGYPDTIPQHQGEKQSPGQTQFPYSLAFPGTLGPDFHHGELKLAVIGEVIESLHHIFPGIGHPQFAGHERDKRALE